MMTTIEDTEILIGTLLTGNRHMNARRLVKSFPEIVQTDANHTTKMLIEAHRAHTGMKMVLTVAKVHLANQVEGMSLTIETLIIEVHLRTVVKRYLPLAEAVRARLTNHLVDIVCARRATIPMVITITRGTSSKRAVQPVQQKKVCSAVILLKDSSWPQL